MSLKSLLRVLMGPLSLLNKVMPKDPELVLFYSNLGFRDNARAVYDECVRRGLGRQVRIVCSLNDFHRYTPPEGQNVRFTGNLRGIFSFLRAGTVFYSFGKYPVKPSRRQTVINVWHGMPLKAVGNMVKGCEKVKYNYFTYVIATAPFFGGILQKCFSCRPEQILYCGQPRCDMLFRDEAPRQRLILWLPTYRRSDALGGADSDWDAPFGVPLLNTREDFKKLDDTLSRLDAVLIIKPHPLQNSAPAPQGLRHIRLMTDDDLAHAGTDLYTLFLQSAALLTDYSSLLFDYLLLDKPLGFILPDYESYQAARGFAVPDPFALMPGPKPGSLSELTEFMEDVLAGRDAYAEERRSVNELCNTYQTGDSVSTLIKTAGLPERTEP